MCMLHSSEWGDDLVHSMSSVYRDCAETRQRLVQLSDVLSCVKAEALGSGCIGGSFWFSTVFVGFGLV